MRWVSVYTGNLADGIVARKICNPGKLALIDAKGNEAASWSFKKLLDHWIRRHTNACYVPSIKGDPRKYQYGDKALFFEDTDFIRFLDQLASKNIFLDPALKIFLSKSDQKSKMRNQFRIISKNLNHLYKKLEIVNLASA